MQEIVYVAPPQNFKPKMEVSACFCIVGNKFLFLKRNDDKPNGGTWCLPAGKLEQGEDLYDGVIREVFEETALALQKTNLTFLKTVYIKYPKIDFVYHMFKSEFENYPEQLYVSKAEHQEFQWLTIDQALQLDLIPGEAECIHLVSGEINTLHK